MSAVVTSQPPAAPAADQHATAAEVLRRYPKLNRTRLYHLVVIGEVEPKLIPGKTPRYRLADLARVMGEQGA